MRFLEEQTARPQVFKNKRQPLYKKPRGAKALELLNYLENKAHTPAVMVRLLAGASIDSDVDYETLKQILYDLWDIIDPDNGVIK